MAHALLCKIHPNHYGLSHALFMMANMHNSHQRRHIVSSRIYAHIRENAIRLMIDYKRNNPIIGSMYGKNHTEETRKLMSEKAKSRHRRLHTDETKAKMKMSGRKAMNEERRLKMSTFQKNRIRTEEEKRKISESAKLRPSPMLGKTHSKEARQKFSKRMSGPSNMNAKRIQDSRNGIIYGTLADCRKSLGIGIYKMNTLIKQGILIKQEKEYEQSLDIQR